MKTGSMIAFPERSLQGKNLSGLQTTRLRVGDVLCIGVPMENLTEICSILGVSEDQISKGVTSYRGIFLASFNKGGHTDTRRRFAATNEHERLKRRYMELCGYNRKAVRIRTLKQETTKLNSGVAKCQEQLVTFLRRLEEKQRQLQAVQGTDEGSLDRYADEFEQLTKHPDIERLEISGRKIVIYTGQIFIEYRQVTYKIGKFKIAIDTLGKEGAVRMINLTGKHEGANHPHIDQGGVPCLGNIKEVIPHMIAQHQYAAAASVCIQYLKSYEYSESYKPYYEIENWPVAKTKKEE